MPANINIWKIKSAHTVLMGECVENVKRLPNNLMPFPISQPCALRVVLFGTFLLNCYFRLLFGGSATTWLQRKSWETGGTAARCWVFRLCVGTTETEKMQSTKEEYHFTRDSFPPPQSSKEALLLQHQKRMLGLQDSNKLSMRNIHTG